MNIQTYNNIFCLYKSKSFLYRQITKQKSILFLLLALLLSVSSTAQNSTLRIGTNIAVVSYESTVPYVEPFIVINPTDSGNMIIGSIKVKESGWESVAHISFDSGSSWIEKNLPIPDSVSLSGDPYLVFNDKGVVYYTMLGRNPTAMGQLLFKSTNKGKSWSVPVWVSTNSKWFFDHSTLAVDNSKESPFYNNVYAVSHVNYRNVDRKLLYAPFVAVSNNKGKSFQHEGTFGPTFQNMNNGDAVITSTGVINFFYFVFMDENGEWLENHRLNVIYSEDGGKTFSNPVLVSDQFTAYYPDAAIDRSDKFKDRVYVTWTYTKEPDRGIFIAYKDGNSNTWSKPIKVSDAKSNTPLISAIAVNDKGVVGVSWFDNRNDPSKNCYDMFFSYSEYGGTSFGKNHRITDESSCPTIEKSGQAFSRWRRGGDYHGLTASGGDFHITWPDARDGLFLPWYAKLSIDDE